MSMDSEFVPTLTEVELEVIDVDEIDEGGTEAFLVGRLVTEEKWNPSNLIEAIMEAWKMKHGGMSSREWEHLKLILFCFDDVMDRDWVLKNQPWHYKGSLFAIKEFMRGNEPHLSSLDNVTIEHASFWARLYDVPVSCMNERSLRIFTTQIGILESVDKSDEDSIGRFLSFKISVNITKPLLRGITVRAKGKQSWLPLKYESLPTYCFSCGTIGHSYKNCQRSSLNLEYCSCKLRTSSSKREKKIEHPLPLDIIENILSRVPVKYLLRFKVVSKQWKAIISDPRFAKIHLQQYKKSSSGCLLLCDNKGFYVANFENHRFHFVSKIKESRKYATRRGIHGYCDGLYLTCRNPFGVADMYALWNPSCRAYQEIPCQPIKHNSCQTITGIYYSPLMNDYKLVIANTEQYAVFSCRYNKWSESERMNYFPSGDQQCSEVHFDGSYYWLIRSNKKEIHLSFEFKILCFDGRIENFKTLFVPYSEGVANWLCLSSSEDHLYLFGVGLFSEMLIFKKVSGDENDPWTELKVPFTLGGTYIDYPIWVSENEFVLDNTADYMYYMLYNPIKGTDSEVQMIGSREFLSARPYLENLFLQ